MVSSFMKYFVSSTLLFFLSNWAFSQISIHYLDSPPKIDAEIGDWNIPFYTFTQTSHVVKSANTLRYAFGFDETNLYGIFEVTDRHLTDLAKDKSGSPRITFNDAIELYIDTQNNSKTSMDGDDFQVIMDCMGNLTVFCGGDNFLIKVEKYRVPKDTVTQHFVIDYKTKYWGTLNDNKDIDKGYVIEFRVAWAALGIRPKPNCHFKMDICLNDADEFLDIRPLSEEAKIPFYAYQNIEGSVDFGFPNQWSKAILMGEASAEKRAIQWLYSQIGVVLFFAFIVTILLIVWLLIQKNKTRITYKVYQVVGQEVSALASSLTSKTTIFVLENLQKDLSPVILAQYFNVSLRQLQRQFKEETDTTPTAFIRKVKLERAAQLLLSTTLTIAEIAYELGFSDPAYFSRIFKKNFGQTPSEFQENAQKI